MIDVLLRVIARLEAGLTNLEQQLAQVTEERDTLRTQLTNQGETDDDR